MEKTIGIFLAAYALILWVLVVFVWHKGYKEWKTNRANRVHTYRARVLDKRAPKGVAETPAPLVLFEFRGRQKEIRVAPEIFEVIKVGDEGLLRLHGDGRFDGFQSQSQDERADDIYRRMVKD